MWADETRQARWRSLAVGSGTTELLSTFASMDACSIVGGRIRAEMSFWYIIKNSNKSRASKSRKWTVRHQSRLQRHDIQYSSSTRSRIELLD